jgi:pilus assembly protein Flp/PilA
MKRRKAMLKIQMFIYNAMHPLKNVEGATAIEYGLLAALIALAMAVGASVLGSGLNNIFDGVGQALDGATIPTVP